MKLRVVNFCGGILWKVGCFFGYVVTKLQAGYSMGVWCGQTRYVALPDKTK